jgi:hypothetical protein
MLAANAEGLCGEVAIELQLFQNPMLLINDLQINLLLQPLLRKANVVR